MFLPIYIIIGMVFKNNQCIIFKYESKESTRVHLYMKVFKKKKNINMKHYKTIKIIDIVP